MSSESEESQSGVEVRTAPSTLLSDNPSVANSALGNYMTIESVDATLVFERIIDHIFHH